MSGQYKFRLDPGKVEPRRTICEVHRQIWRAAEGDPHIRALAEEAYDMAKRMNAKLREYKNDWDAGWWEKNHGDKRDSSETD